MPHRRTDAPAGLGISILNDDEGPLSRSSYAMIPERPDLGLGEEEIQGYTSDPVVVVLARRAWDAEHSGRWAPAPVSVPSRAEAELGTWMKPEQLYSRNAAPAPDPMSYICEPLH